MGYWDVLEGCTVEGGCGVEGESRGGWGPVLSVLGGESGVLFLTGGAWGTGGVGILSGSLSFRRMPRYGGGRFAE